MKDIVRHLDIWQPSATDWPATLPRIGAILGQGEASVAGRGARLPWHGGSRSVRLAPSTGVQGSNDILGPGLARLRPCLDKREHGVGSEAPRPFAAKQGSCLQASTLRRNGICGPVSTWQTFRRSQANRSSDLTRRAAAHRQLGLTHPTARQHGRGISVARCHRYARRCLLRRRDSGSSHQRRPARPLICVTDVFKVASGDLSLPGRGTPAE